MSVSVDFSPTVGEVWRGTHFSNVELCIENNGMAEANRNPANDGSAYEQSRSLLSSLFHRYSVCQFQLVSIVYVAYKLKLHKLYLEISVYFLGTQCTQCSEGKLLFLTLQTEETTLWISSKHVPILIRFCADYRKNH